MLTRQMLTRHMLTTLMEKETFAPNFVYRSNLYLSEMAASHFLQVQVKSQVISLQVQVKSQVISLQVQVKSQLSHFLASPSQVTSHLVRRQVKSSHKSFGPNTSQVTNLFAQVQVKSHIISSTPIIRRGI